jgi:hypothetical protein
MLRARHGQIHELFPILQAEVIHEEPIRQSVLGLIRYPPCSRIDGIEIQELRAVASRVHFHLRVDVLAPAADGERSELGKLAVAGPALEVDLLRDSVRRRGYAKDGGGLQGKVSIWEDEFF